MAHTEPTHYRFAMSEEAFPMMAPSPEGQRLVSRKALSLGGSRERSGRGEFFTRSRMIGTTHSKARNVCSVSARYHASSFKAIMRGVPREKARSEPVGSAPPAPRRCPLLPSAAFARHTVATLNWQCLSFTISEFHSLLVHFIRAEIRTIRPHDCSMVRNYM